MYAKKAWQGKAGIFMQMYHNYGSGCDYVKRVWLCKWPCAHIEMWGFCGLGVAMQMKLWICKRIGTTKGVGLCKSAGHPRAVVGNRGVASRKGAGLHGVCPQNGRGNGVGL